MVPPTLPGFDWIYYGMIWHLNKRMLKEGTMLESMHRICSSNAQLSMDVEDRPLVTDEPVVGEIFGHHNRRLRS
jgi:hypothetical protein